MPSSSYRRSYLLLLASPQYPLVPQSFSHDQEEDAMEEEGSNKVEGEEYQEQARDEGLSLMCPPQHQTLLDT